MLQILSEGDKSCSAAVLQGRCSQVVMSCVSQCSCRSCRGPASQHAHFQRHLAAVSEIMREPSAGRCCRVGQCQCHGTVMSRVRHTCWPLPYSPTYWLGDNLQYLHCKFRLVIKMLRSRVWEPSLKISISCAPLKSDPFEGIWQQRSFYPLHTLYPQLNKPLICCGTEVTKTMVDFALCVWWWVVWSIICILIVLLHMMRTSVECCNIHPQINSADGREQERANFSAAVDGIRTTYHVKWLLWPEAV